MATRRNALMALVLVIVEITFEKQNPDKLDFLTNTMCVYNTQVTPEGTRAFLKVDQSQ